MATTTVCSTAGIAQDGSPPPQGSTSPPTLVDSSMVDTETHEWPSPACDMAVGGDASLAETRGSSIEWFAKLNRELGNKTDFVHCPPRLTTSTAAFAAGCRGVCAFVNDDVSTDGVEELSRLSSSDRAALRWLQQRRSREGQELGIVDARGPAYSPHAVAVHAVALMLASARKIPMQARRARMGDFSFNRN
jgi:D-lactate dehydrogenase